MKPANILIVEDETIVGMDLKLKLQSRGYNVLETASTGQEAIEISNKYNPDLILMDIILDGNIDGIEAASQISTRQQIPIIYITGNSDFVIDERLLATQPVEVLIKPVHDLQLFEIIKQALPN
ncbi:hypothetical protein B6I21_09415 [candidate division KSB1 bacterium 4572_119]|nr:MAG: hypothetical protein B6I21_09415 [candidate division KSB1 bacterium 4572_119]